MRGALFVLMTGTNCRSGEKCCMGKVLCFASLKESMTHDSSGELAADVSGGSVGAYCYRPEVASCRSNSLKPIYFSV